MRRGGWGKGEIGRRESDEVGDKAMGRRAIPKMFSKSSMLNGWYWRVKAGGETRLEDTTKVRCRRAIPDIVSKSCMLLR